MKWIFFRKLKFEYVRRPIQTDLGQYTHNFFSSLLCHAGRRFGFDSRKIKFDTSTKGKKYVYSSLPRWKTAHFDADAMKIKMLSSNTHSTHMEFEKRNVWEKNIVRSLFELLSFHHLRKSKKRNDPNARKWTAEVRDDKWPYVCADSIVATQHRCHFFAMCSAE